MKWLCVLPILWSTLSAAQDAFEIQVYDSQTAPPLSPGLELHLNNTLVGSTQATGPELADNLVTHITFEPHLGVAPWAELGGYLQTALRPDGAYQYAGLKLRVKARWPRKLWNWLGLALNVEFSSVPPAYEAAVQGVELRPILDALYGRWYASFNPILTFSPALPNGWMPQPEPAAKVRFACARSLGLGLEYYLALGPALSSTGPPVQRLFAALDWGSAHVDLNVGVGVGFGAPERVILKAIIGVHPAESL